MPRGNQLVRQWQLLQFLARPGGLTVEDAAGQLDCTVRTVWRDLRVLQDAGFRHLVNLRTRRAVHAANLRLGYPLIEIVSPEEV